MQMQNAFPSSAKPGPGPASTDDITLTLCNSPGICLQGNQHIEQKYTCSPLSLLESDLLDIKFNAIYTLGILSKGWTKLK